MSALLEVTNLKAFYGARPVLHGLNFAVQERSIATILGANGAGKTTTLCALCHMTRTTGEITFAGERIEARRTDEIARLGIAHVPYGRGTFNDFEVEENLHVGAYTRSDKAIGDDLERVYTYFPRLKERRRQQAGTLSGGEQQMLAIGRALMLRPRLLLLDEPSFGLAPLIVAEIFRIMKQINERDNVTILLVEQNARLALELASEAHLMETGRLVLSGNAKDVGDDESVRRAYLGY